MQQGHQVADGTAAEAAATRREVLKPSGPERSSQHAMSTDRVARQELDEQTPEEAGYGYGV
jgi:hypothetical protein